MAFAVKGGVLAMLTRYCDPRQKLSPIATRPWSIRLRGEWWTFGTQGHVLVAVQGKYAKRYPKGAPTVEDMLTKSRPTQRVRLDDLKRWADRPERPSKWSRPHKARHGVVNGIVFDRELIARAVRPFDDLEVTIATDGPWQPLRIRGKGWAALVMGMRVEASEVRYPPCPLTAAPDSRAWEGA